MKLPDLDRVRSEKRRTLVEFLRSYNEGLPSQFPQASLPLLREFQKENKALFKNDAVWSLEQHRKKVMDWLTVRTKSISSS